ncbi:MAG: ANTAR domain-containing protein [Pseudomonadota bacterium]
MHGAILGMSSPDLSILIIDEDTVRSAVIESGLREAGYRRLMILNDIRGLAKKIADANPDVIVIDLGNPNRDMLESMFQLSRAAQRPVAMFVDQSDKAATEAAIEAGVSAYIVDGLKKERVTPIMELAVSRFNAYARMARELEEAKTALEGRKVIDKAKGILMRSKGLDEEEAYALMRKAAMNQNRKLTEVAESLILAAGLLD